MILLISNIANEAAPAWIKTFPAGAASLITASDFNLSFKAGISVSEFSSSSLFIQGRQTDVHEISGVISTVPGFSPLEFYYINPADREYVCTEVNSFINYFLSELTCKKMNPPTRKSFSGLSLQKIEWVKIAHTLNVPVQSFSMKNGKIEYPEKAAGFKTLSCTLINDRIMESDVHEKVHTYTRLLANKFSLPYLTCYFSTTDDNHFHLLDINSIPDITNSLHRDAIINYFNP